MTENRRMKLSDVEAQANYLFRNAPTSFAVAYPTVESLRVEVEASAAMWGDRAQRQIFTEQTLQPIINCRNPRCYGGGIDLDRLLRFSVVGSKLASFENTFFCSGYEGSPKGRKKTGSCDTSFKVKISVSYKPEDSSQSHQSLSEK